MADKKTGPNDLFGQMLTQWEDLSNQMANTVMGSDQFGQGQQAAMMASLKIRETMQEQMSRFLEVTNQPSREDMVELRAGVAKLDAKMDRIERQLQSLAELSQMPAPKVKQPPRTRKPRTTASKAKKDV